MASPNTIDADLYPTIVGESMISAFNDMLKPLNVFATDFSGEAATPYQAIVIPIENTGNTVSDKVEGSNYSNNGTTFTETTITMNRHKNVDWTVTDREAAESRINTLEKMGRQKGQDLAIAVWQDILSVVTAANYGAAAFTGAASTFDHDDVIDIQTVCDNAKWGEMDRAMILKPDYYNAIFRDGVVGADVYGSALVARGEVPELAGFDMHKTTAIPANGENLVGFACKPNALAIANRYLPPSGGGKPGSIYRQFTHAESGLTLGYREWYDDDSGVRKAIAEAYYGFATGNTDGIQRLVSA